MNTEAYQRELKAAYEKLEAKEKTIATLALQLNESNRVIDVLKAAGFLSDEKLKQAREIVENLT